MHCDMFHLFGQLSHLSNSLTDALYRISNPRRPATSFSKPEAAPFPCGHTVGYVRTYRLKGGLWTAYLETPLIVAWTLRQRAVHQGHE